MPLSIIIIGVGNADFSNMIELDGDQGLIDSMGKKAKRDLVQFVNYMSNQSLIDLTTKVLEELPT